MSGCDRREFVVRALGAVAVLTLPGCASTAVAHVPLDRGALTVRPADHPSLASPGGVLRLQAAGTGALVYLLAVEGGYVALSPICTHLGCTVGIEGPRLVCPCHGSTYDRQGLVLRGPAARPLRSYPVHTREDGSLSILLEDR